jgi:Ca2+-binding RTX toxin-like protein
MADQASFKIAGETHPAVARHASKKATRLAAGSSAALGLGLMTASSSGVTTQPPTAMQQPKEPLRQDRDDGTGCAHGCAVPPEFQFVAIAGTTARLHDGDGTLLTALAAGAPPTIDAAEVIAHWRFFFEFGWWEGRVAEGPTSGGESEGFSAAALRPGEVSVEIFGEPDSDGVPGLADADRFGDRYFDPWGAGGASGGSPGIAESTLLTSGLEGGGGNAPLFGRTGALDASRYAARIDGVAPASSSSAATSPLFTRADAPIPPLASGAGPSPASVAQPPSSRGQEGGGSETPPPPPASVGRLDFSLFRDSLPPGWNPDAPTRHDALWRDPVLLAETMLGPVIARPGGELSVTNSEIFTSLRFASGTTVGTDGQPAVTAVWDAAGSFALLSQELAWGTIRNLSVTAFTGDRLELENWLDAFVTLNSAQPLTLIVEGAQRGEVVLGGASSKSVTIGMENAGDGTTAHFLVVTGRADDFVFLRGTEREGASAAYDGSDTSTVIFTGAGDDLILGWGSSDTVDGGSGRDVFVLRGLQDGYTITADGAWTVVRDIDASDGDDGTDRLINVEVLRLADGTEFITGSGGGAGGGSGGDGDGGDGGGSDDGGGDTGGGDGGDDGEEGGGPNDAPVFVADPALSVRPGETAVIDADALLANDLAGDGMTLTIASITPSSTRGGSIVETAPGSFLYAPQPGFRGVDTVTYTIADDLGRETTGTLTVIVNTPPDLRSDPLLSATAAAPAVIVPAALLANDRDADGDTLSFAGIAETSARGGSIVAAGDGRFVYTPPPGFFGLDTITYTVTDGLGDVLGTVRVIVTNSAPVPVTDAPLRLLDVGPVTIVAADLVANDIDADGHALSVSGAAAERGTLTQREPGVFEYAPPPGFVGEDRITYTVGDGFGGSASASLSVIVGNRAPVQLSDQPLNVRPGESVWVNASQLLSRFADPDGDSLRITGADETTAEGGSIDAPGFVVFTYTPPEGFLGRDVFTFTVEDAFGAITTGELAIEVINSAPVFTPDAPLSVAAGEVGLIDGWLLAANDIDDDSDAVTVSSFSATTEAGGTVTALGAGLFLYTPPQGFTGEDLFRYVIDDGYGGSAEATLGLIVTPPLPAEAAPEAPGAGPDAAPYVLSALTDLRFRLAGGEDEDNAIDLSDQLIDGSEAIDDTGEPLIMPVSLNEGGLGQLRTVTITDAGGNNTVLAGDPVLARLFVAMGAGSDLIEGGRGSDVIVAGGGNNMIRGFGGNDRIHAGGGDDVIDGGDGNDTIAVSGGNNVIDGGTGNDLITAAGGNDTIRGGSGHDVIEAGEGDNVVEGGEGNDRIVAGAGDDTIDGGDGDDVITVAAGENVIAGGGGHDVIITGAGNDRIVGGDGEDEITSGAGDDVIDAGTGDDMVQAGAGDDAIGGGEGNDMLEGAEGDDVIDGGKGDDTLVGGEGNDTLIGGAGDDVIRGGPGDDVIEDGAGADTVFMAGGNDTLHNAADGARDVFVWDDLAALLENPEYDIIGVLDLQDARTGDVLDFVSLGAGLFAELYGGQPGNEGSFVIYLSEEDRRKGEYILAVEWIVQIGDGPLQIGSGANAHIRIGTGWTVIDPVSGDTFV